MRNVNKQEQPTSDKSMNVRMRWLRIGMLVLGVLFIILGITRGEPLEVLVKAIRICLECIGIG